MRADYTVCMHMNYPEAAVVICHVDQIALHIDRALYDHVAGLALYGKDWRTSRVFNLERKGLLAWHLVLDKEAWAFIRLEDKRRNG